MYVYITNIDGNNQKNINKQMKQDQWSFDDYNAALWLWICGLLKFPFLIPKFRNLNFPWAEFSKVNQTHRTVQWKFWKTYENLPPLKKFDNLITSQNFSTSILFFLIQADENYSPEVKIGVKSVCYIYLMLQQRKIASANLNSIYKHWFWIS